MRIGELDERVRVQTPTEVRGERGGTSLVWDPPADEFEVWAKVEQTGGGETREGERVTGRARFTVTLRHRDGLSERQRLVWRGRVLQVESVSGTTRRGRRVELACVETDPERAEA